LTQEEGAEQTEDSKKINTQQGQNTHTQDTILSTATLCPDLKKNLSHEIDALSSSCLIVALHDSSSSSPSYSFYSSKKNQSLLHLLLHSILAIQKTQTLSQDTIFSTAILWI